MKLLIGSDGKGVKRGVDPFITTTWGKDVDMSRVYSVELDKPGPYLYWEVRVALAEALSSIDEFL